MADTTFIAVILASCFACLFTGAGIFLISRYEHWAKRNSTYFVSFAAGALLSVAFLHLVPEAIEMFPTAPFYFLAGFLALYIFNRFTHLHVGHEHDHEGQREHLHGIVPVIGIGFHSFVDGIIYTVTFNVSIFTGALAAIGMILHEVPEGVISFVLLSRAGFSRRQAIIFAFLAAGLSTPLGTLVSFPFISDIGEPALGLLLALAAGVLLYVGGSHLLPEVEREQEGYTVLTLIAGVAIAVLTLLIGE